MADTSQVVSWALEYACSLRGGEAVVDISAAGAAVGLARGLGEAMAEPDGRFGIFGDVRVTSVTGATLPTRLLKGATFFDRMFSKYKTACCSDYPSDGYIISEQFGPSGGVEGVLAMCRDCPVNTSRPHPAGCVGTIRQSPDDGFLQRELEAIVARLQLQAVIKKHFALTTPIWYGLWTKPVLSPEGAGVLASIAEALDKTRESHGQLRAFVTAARIAERGVARLHVEMAPPGHTDFGLYTVFAHCPLCKAEAELERWKGKYPKALYRCRVCGTEYSPAEQASVTRYSHKEGPDLRALLGEEAFLAFARDYLVKRGHTRADAEEIVELTERRMLEGRKNWEKEQQKQRQCEAYIERRLYAGLTRDSMTTERYGEDVTVKGFRAVDIEKLIGRCEALGIEITEMAHRSRDEDRARSKRGWAFPGEKVEPFSPRETLAQWRQEGCDELFECYFKIPERLIEDFSNNSE